MFTVVFAMSAGWCDGVLEPLKRFLKKVWNGMERATYLSVRDDVQPAGNFASYYISGEVTMIRRTVSALVLVACTFAPVASHAFPLFGKSETAQAKVKMVKMTLKNRSAAPMEIIIDDKPVTLAANGGEYHLNAPEGTKVYGTDKSVKVTVTRDLAGSTCSFR